MKTRKSLLFIILPAILVATIIILTADLLHPNSEPQPTGANQPDESTAPTTNANQPDESTESTTNANHPDESTEPTMNSDDSTSILSADQLITNTYDLQSLRAIMGITNNGESELHHSWTYPVLHTFDHFFPIECVRDVSEELKYVVYKLKNRDDYTAFAYLFFEKNGDYWDARNSRMMLVDRRLSYEDFATIQIGSLLSDVKAITKVADMQKSERVNTFTSYHYLEDGILFIDFERQSSDDVFTVVHIDFFEERYFISFNGERINMDILDIDFPPSTKS